MPVKSSAAGGCSHYENLLQECRQALETCQRQQVQFYRAGANSRRVGDELERLHAKYARSYAALESHEQSCPTCQYVSKIGGLDFESMSHAVLSYKAAAGR